MRLIHELNKTNKTFTSTVKADKAFEKIKNRLLTTGHFISKLFAAFHPYHRCQRRGLWGHSNAGSRQRKEKDYSSRLILIQPHGTELVYHKTGSVRNKMVDPKIFAYHSTSTVPTEKNCDHINTTAEQLTDNLLSKIIPSFSDKGSKPGMSHGSEGPSNTPLQETSSKFLFGIRYLCSDDQRLHPYTKAGRVIQTS